MYYGMLHTHTLFVALYILFFLFKLILLMGGKTETLARVRSKTKVLEMILPTLFLATGIYLATQSPYIAESWFIGKMVLLAIAIVLGIFTFKKNNIALGVITLLIFVYMYGISETKSLRMVNRLSKTIATQEAPHEGKLTPGSPSYDRIAHGAYLFKTKGCDACHGEMGDKGLAGAGNLRTSQLKDEEISTVIMNGKKNMSGYRKYLSEEEIKALTEYVKSLRK
jgi:mono/diheme cytochrome c family protein